MRTVAGILQQKGPHFNQIKINATVREAITLMKAENLSYMIVMEEGVYKGIFSERDYTHKVILQDKHSDTALVSEVMSTEFPTITPSDRAAYCMELMNSAKTRYLPVFEGRDFKGVITIHDLLRESIAENQKELAGENFFEDVSKSELHYWI